MSDSEKAEVNDNVRKQFDNIIHGKSPKTEREKEIDKLAREELEKKTKEELINIIIKMQIDIREERDEIYRRRLLDTF